MRHSILIRCCSHRKYGNFNINTKGKCHSGVFMNINIEPTLILGLGLQKWPLYVTTMYV